MGLLFLFLFWKNPLLSAGRTRFSKTKKKQKLGPIFNTSKGKIGPAFNSTAYIYIYPSLPPSLPPSSSLSLSIYLSPSLSISLYIYNIYIYISLSLALALALSLSLCNGHWQRIHEYEQIVHLWTDFLIKRHHNLPHPKYPSQFSILSCFGLFFWLRTELISRPEGLNNLRACMVRSSRVIQKRSQAPTIGVVCVKEGGCDNSNHIPCLRHIQGAIPDRHASERLLRSFQVSEANAYVWEEKNCWPGPSAECVGDLYRRNLGGVCRGFSWMNFLATFPTKIKEKRSGNEICENEKIRRLEKEKSAKNPSYQEPTLKAACKMPNFASERPLFWNPFWTVLGRFFPLLREDSTIRLLMSIFFLGGHWHCATLAGSTVCFSMSA